MAAAGCLSRCCACVWGGGWGVLKGSGVGVHGGVCGHTLGGGFSCDACAVLLAVSPRPSKHARCVRPFPSHRHAGVSAGGGGAVGQGPAAHAAAARHARAGAKVRGGGRVRCAAPGASYVCPVVCGLCPWSDIIMSPTSPCPSAVRPRLHAPPALGMRTTTRCRFVATHLSAAPKPAPAAPAAVGMMHLCSGRPNTLHTAHYIHVPSCCRALSAPSHHVLLPCHAQPTEQLPTGHGCLSPSTAVLCCVCP